MEIIDFKAGAQIISGPIVRDIYGSLWTVLKNIANATAQPREGAYYTRYLEPVVVEPEMEYIDVDVHPNDFYIQEEVIDGQVVKRLRIKR